MVDMNIYTIMEEINKFNINGFEIFWLIIFVSLVIQITPIKINPWSWLSKQVQKFIGIQSLREEFETTSIENRRVRILRFGDEVRLGQKHSQKHFEQIIYDIDQYDIYCTNHPNFRNSLTTSAAKLIKETYDNCVKNNNFL